MRLVFKSGLILFAACGSFSLIACGNSNHANHAPDSTGTAAVTKDADHNSHDHGHTSIHSDIAHAQIIMSGPYHLELIAESKDHGLNLNFHLEYNANQEAIPDATVTAIVQTPDGNEETLDLQYESTGEHYIGSLNTDVMGQFGVTILADLNGEQVDAAFSFER